MGKKSASKDRGYITATEWKVDGGGWKDTSEGLPFRRLPFNCCAVSFLPFEDPVCAPDGTVMDIMHAVPYVQKHGKHPVTGEPLELKDLTKLTFHKNQEGAYECPVLNKAFTNSAHIVAVKSTGNVYSYQAIDELCVKPKNWKDLLTDEKFTRKDLVTIQDPMNLNARALDSFEHVKKGLGASVSGAVINKASNVNQKGISADTRRVLERLGTADASAALQAGGGGRKAQAERALAAAKQAGDAAASGFPSERSETLRLLRGPSPASHPLDNVRFRPGSHTWNTDGETAHDAAFDAEKRRKAAQEKMRTGGLYASVGGAERRVNEMRTTGASSTAFTSTVMARAGVANERAIETVVRNPKKKGYARLKTSLGDLNLELHCDFAPRACENFIALAGIGYYDGVVFHRSIKNFMIQGGDPTGTGAGGQSIWGGTFKDEITHLKHDGRGTVSMANGGPGTNGSQFFVAYKSAPHLDGKHTVFGNVVGGMETLAKMERVDVDADDRPVTPIVIESVEVFVDPYKDAAMEERDAEESKRKADERDEKERLEALRPGKWWSDPAGEAAKLAGDGPVGRAGGGVGKYLSAAGGSAKRNHSGEQVPDGDPVTKKAKPTGGYGNFDGW